jgi:hypothetical protein
MELIDNHQVFLIRLEPDIWAEVGHGTLISLDLLRPGERERRPAFLQGDVLLLYHPQSDAPDAPTAELSHVVTVRSELSNGVGYALGPVFRIVPALSRDRLLFASQRGILPEVFRRVDDRTLTYKLLTSDQRNEFVDYVLNAGITLEPEEGKGGRPVTEQVGETPGIVEYEW